MLLRLEIGEANKKKVNRIRSRKANKKSFSKGKRNKHAGILST